MMRSLLLCLTLLPVASASATEWRAGADARLTFQGSYQGDAFDGAFERFTPAITFDADDLSSASFDVEIDITSAKTGIGEYDSGMQDAEFFHGSRFPVARFVARSFRALGENRYQADAELTIRDKTVSLPFPFQFVREGDGARLTSAVTLQRLDFDVGIGDWTDTSLIANEVSVRVDLPLVRAD